MKKIILVFIISSIIFPVFSQEILTGLQGNPILKNIPKPHATKGVQDTISLPFLDDFSANTIYPDTKLWQDNYAYINYNYPTFPVTIGVAILDALDAKGNIYSNASTQDTFRADRLTSRPIDLGKKGVKDSVYFSFFFQPGGGINNPLQGYGDAPEKNDMLVLEFTSFPPDTLTTIDTLYTATDTIYTPISTIVPRWNQVWSSEGMTLDDFHTKYGTYFKQILVPVNDSIYFFKGFQFRFRNYASLYNGIETGWASGNVDLWALDYVYLNSGRNVADTNITDVALIAQNTSLLKDYESIPWSHYESLSAPTAIMNSTFKIPFINLDKINTRNVYRYFKITDLLGGSSPYLLPLNSINVKSDSIAYLDPTINYVFPKNNADSAVFCILDSIKTFPDTNKYNNTSSFYQRFYNYYAYDDGVPENGYGLNGQGAISYRFNNYMTDTLRAVMIYFNKTLDNQNVIPFDLTVWGDNKNKPGKVLYQKTSVVPMFEDSLNQFHMYRIDTSVVINAGAFYVGWVQNANVSLNVGFDRSTNQQINLIVNYKDPSIYSGTLMIRPVFGKQIPFLASVPERNLQAFSFKIFPNPISKNNNLTFQISPTVDDKSQVRIEIYDITGKIMLLSNLNKNIDISGFSDGIYFIKMTDVKKSLVAVQKLVITR